MTGNSKIKIIKIEVGEAPAGFYRPFLERVISKPLKVSFLDESEINPNLEDNFTREVLPIQKFAYNSSFEEYYMRDEDKKKFEELVNKYIDLYKQSLIKWLEGQMKIPAFQRGNELIKTFGRNDAIYEIINHIKES